MLWLRIRTHFFERLSWTDTQSSVRTLSEHSSDFYTNESCFSSKALCSQLASDSPGERNVIANSSAGTVPDIILLSGTCCRISTGCAAPNGADAVVEIEDTKLVKHS